MQTTVYPLLLIAAFVGVVIQAFGRERKERFEKDARIPFDGDKH
jgi:cbb3-type cytochrome oxidase subunit 3